MVLPDVPRGCTHLSFLKSLLVPISHDMNRRAMAGIALGVAIVTAGACASSGVRPDPFPTPPTAPEPAPEATPLSVPRGAATDGFTIATAALQLQGIPYRLGGTDVHGFDCSGLVQYVFALYGVTINIESADASRSMTSSPAISSSSRRTATTCRTWAS